MIDTDNIVLRPLPRRITPLPNEVLATFLVNLSRCNGLPDTAAKQVIAETSCGPLAAIAHLTGLGASALTAALPELRQTSPAQAAKRSQPGSLGFDGTTVACTSCTRRRGDGHPTRVWTHHHDTICWPHTRWVGSPIMHSDQQFNASHHPNILAANRQHHRLVRRYHSRGADAFCRAISLIDRWHRSHGLPAVHALQHKLRSAHSQLHTPASLTSADLQAALYPPAVRLAYLIATPDWLAHATHNLPSWNTAADHIARHITGGYRPIGMNLDVFEHIQQEFDRWPIHSERVARQSDPPL